MPGVAFPLRQLKLGVLAAGGRMEHLSFELHGRPHGSIGDQPRRLRWAQLRLEPAPA